MIVQCENCSTKFRVDEDRIKDEGSRVRCSVCKNVFTIFRETPESEERPEDRIDLDELRASAEDLTPAQADTGFDETVLPPIDNDLGLGDLEATARKEAPEPEAVEEEEEVPALAEDEPAAVFEEEAEEAEEEVPAESEALIGEEPEEEALAETAILAEEEGGVSEEEARGFEESLAGFEKEMDQAIEEETDQEIEEEPSPAVDFEHEQVLQEEAPEEFVLESEEPLPQAVKPRVPKRGRTLLWILILLLAVVAAAAGVNYFQPGLLPSLIPGLSQKVEPDPLGRSQIFLDDKLTKDSWRTNQSAGQLLIITGLAKNISTGPRSYIQLRVVLNSATNEILARKMVYCGNILSEEDLETLSMEEINRRLQDRAGASETNTNVPPGQSVPFMAVFDNVPAALSTFGVEVIGSQPGQAAK